MTDISVPDVDFFLGLLLRSTAIVCLVGVAAAIVRSISVAAASRHLLWMLALCAVALLPALSGAMPKVSIEVPHSFSVLAIAKAAPSPGKLSFAGAEQYLDIGVGVWVTYALGVTILLARLIMSRLTLERMWHRAGQIEASIDLRELERQMGVAHDAKIRVASMSTAPLTWADRILLPVEAKAWTAERLRDVCLHELGHMARRDSLTQMLASVVRAFFWFSPAVWYALGRLRMEQEHACDERVLAAGAHPDAYAQTLLDIAGGLGHARISSGVSAAMVKKSNLERRVVAIVTPRGRRHLSLSHIVVLGGLIFGSTAMIAAADPVERSGLPSLVRLNPTIPQLTAKVPELSPTTPKLALHLPELSPTLPKLLPTQQAGHREDAPARRPHARRDKTD